MSALESCPLCGEKVSDTGSYVRYAACSNCIYCARMDAHRALVEQAAKAGAWTNFMAAMDDFMVSPVSRANLNLDQLLRDERKKRGLR